jgi:DNA uptake protein ComE-like DNA-binding protein
MQSWYVLPALIFLGFASLIYIGIRTKTKKWIFSGIIHSVLFINFVVATEVYAVTSLAYDLAVGAFFISYVWALLQCIFSIREYLMRLQVVQSLRKDTLSASIEADYGVRLQTQTPQSTPPPVQHVAVNEPAPIVDNRAESVVESSTPVTEPTSGTLDINAASEEELAKLPGIGLILAKKAVAHRQQIGGFATTNQFFEYLQLKPHIVERIQSRVSASKPENSTNVNENPSGRLVDF